ncbi:MAG TPA: FAD-dependent oxidoreductase [Pyrinomonadaceae bacterium]|nr:FAD-dependent oxidoreductase [Pyrinomonadaceae bacterium]
MNFEVVVVGGGIGGLTAAALLAARGLSVCLFERQSQVGGCVANVEHQGYKFEPTFGLYSGWERGGIFDQVFSELPVDPPKVRPLSPFYHVRLPDGLGVSVGGILEQFENSLAEVFPECASAAVDFYRELSRSPSETSDRTGTVASQLTRCSARFRRFVDVQLQTLIQCASDECSYELAAAALSPQSGNWSIAGGAQSLADALAMSLKQSGGTLRLNSPVLRLAYGSDGLPIGIDLLNGERVIATRAIVSNLTVWDTYGKLVGLNKTPRTVSTQLRQMQSWGAYLVFVSLDSSAVPRISPRVLALTDWQEAESYDPQTAQLVFSAPWAGEAAAGGKLGATVSTFTKAEDWFSFHEDHSTHEEQDQAMLETVWSRLHAAMPELGDSVEVIETATPQTFYETTRRRFGMIGRPAARIPQTPPFANLFLVGDTVTDSFGLAGVVKSALHAANAVRSSCK